MQIDEIAYLDQLHERATDETLFHIDRMEAERKFAQAILKVWPEVSKAFDELKHSL